MAPKKGGKKKGGNDDWEAELGETISPASPAADAAANGDQDEEGGGGLMNLLKKRKEKRKNKGLDNDKVEGEDSMAVDDDAAAQYQPPDLSTKAPEEANLDDEFALPDKKGKGGKGKPAQTKAGQEDEETGEGGRVLTKAEKEKLKKEREKQRKKEQVSHDTKRQLSFIEVKC